MSTILQQIINIFVVPPGNLIYHLVLAFSVMGALQIAMLARLRAASGAGGYDSHLYWQRMLVGLSLLLALRLALFAAAAAGWQGLVNDRQLLPPLDRLSTLLGLVVLLWLWAFPRPSRLGDASTALLGLLALTGSLLAVVWWGDQGLQESFNNTWTAFGLDAFALLLAGLGALLLALRRPEGWGWGLGMCLLLAAGHALQLYTGDLQSDYPALARLAQLTAFPLLLTLPGRFASEKTALPLLQAGQAIEGGTGAEQTAPAAKLAERGGEARRDSVAAAELLEAALSLGLETEPEKVHQAIARAVSQAFLADICLLLTPPGAHGSMTVLAGYDLIRAGFISPANLNSSTIPVIASSLRRGRSVRLPFNSASPDLPGLAELLDLDQTGHVAAIPVFHTGKQLAAGIVLLAPHSGRNFFDEDLRRLEEAAEPVAQLLQHASTTANLQAELEQARQQLEQQRSEAGHARQELQALQALLQEMAAKPVGMPEAEDTIASLRAEVERLRAMLEAAPPPAAAANTEQSIPQRLLRNTGQLQADLEGELRLALEEVAQLTLALQAADQRIQELKAQPSGKPEPAGSPSELLTTIAQDLRQPMSSIIGYTDFLLGESVGILGALQRRFLERIRHSTLRMARLLNELLELASKETLPGGEQSNRVDLEKLLDETLLAAARRLREKDITLRVELPDQTPGLRTDQAALQQMLERLLENASLVTPAQGQISLRICLHSDGSQQNYALIQVSDQGGGIRVQDLPRLFMSDLNAPGAENGKASLTGVGLPLEEMARLKLLAEALGGRLWVESEPGAGATYSLLVPAGSEPVSKPAALSQQEPV